MATTEPVRRAPAPAPAPAEAGERRVPPSAVHTFEISLISPGGLPAMRSSKHTAPAVFTVDVKAQCVRVSIANVPNSQAVIPAGATFGLVEQSNYSRDGTRDSSITCYRVVKFTPRRVYLTVEYGRDAHYEPGVVFHRTIEQFAHMNYHLPHSKVPPRIYTPFGFHH